MADESLDILIRTLADQKGVEEIQQSLDKVKGSTKQMGEQAVQSHAKGGEAAEKHSKHLHAMHKIFHALNEAVPGLGVIMQAVFSPIGAIITLVVLALHSFLEKVKESHEAMKKMEEEATKPLTNRLEMLDQVTSATAESQEKLKQRLNDAAHSERGMAEAAEAATRAMHEQAQATSAIQDATMQLELANLEKLHKAKLISEEEFEKRRMEIEARYRKMRRDAELQEIKDEIAIRAALLQNAIQQKPGLDEAAKKADLAKNAAQATAQSREDGLAKSKENKKSAEEALKEWEAKHWDSWDSEGIGDTNTRDEFQKAYDRGDGQANYRQDQDEFNEWYTLKKNLERSEKNLDASKHAVPEAKVKAAEAEHDAEKTERAATKNSQDIDKSEEDLKEQGIKLQIKQKVNEKMDDIDRKIYHQDEDEQPFPGADNYPDAPGVNRKKKSESKRKPEAFPGSDAFPDAPGAGGPLSQIQDSQSKTNQSLDQFLQQLQKHHEHTADALQKGVQMMGHFNDQMSEIKNRADQQHSRSTQGGIGVLPGEG